MRSWLSNRSRPSRAFKVERLHDIQQATHFQGCAEGMPRMGNSVGGMPQLATQFEALQASHHQVSTRPTGLRESCLQKLYTLSEGENAWPVKKNSAEVSSPTKWSGPAGWNTRGLNVSSYGRESAGDCTLHSGTGGKSVGEGVASLVGELVKHCC